MPKVLPLLLVLLPLLRASPEPAGLLRVPRVYNALITTDERLLPSRAVSVSAPLLGPAPLLLGAPLGAPLGSPFGSPLLPAPAAAPAAAARAENASEPAPPAPAAAEAPEDPTNSTAPGALAPAPAVLPLYNHYYSYQPALLPYWLHQPAPLVLFHPVHSVHSVHPLLSLAPAPAGFAPGLAPAGPAKDAPPPPPTDAAGRALPAGAKDDPENDAVSVEAN